jgi:hypothetical protein
MSDDIDLAQKRGPLREEIGLLWDEAANVLQRDNLALEAIEREGNLGSEVELIGHGWALRIDNARIASCGITAARILIHQDQYEITIEPTWRQAARRFDLRHLIDPNQLCADDYEDDGAQDENE